jgi:hypothetical protein
VTVALAHGRVLMLWGMLGAAVAVGLHLVGAFLGRENLLAGPAGHVLLTVNVLINPSTLLGMTRYYEIPMGGYDARQVLDLALFNIPVYAVFGWALWLARRGLRPFELLAAAIATPFLAAAACTLVL